MYLSKVLGFINKINQQTLTTSIRALNDARLNSTHDILMKIGNKKELKRIAEEKSGHLDYKSFLKIYNYCTIDPYSFMIIDTRLTASVIKNFNEPIDLSAEH